MRSRLVVCRKRLSAEWKHRSLTRPLWPQYAHLPPLQATPDLPDPAGPPSFPTNDLERHLALGLPWPQVTRWPLEKIPPALLAKLPGNHPGSAAVGGNVPEDKVNLYPCTWRSSSACASTWSCTCPGLEETIPLVWCAKSMAHTRKICSIAPWKNLNVDILCQNKCPFAGMAYLALEIFARWEMNVGRTWWWYKLHSHHWGFKPSLSYLMQALCSRVLHVGWLPLIFH